MFQLSHPATTGCVFGLPHQELRETEARVKFPVLTQQSPPEMPAEGGFQLSHPATTACRFGLPHQELRETEARVQSLQGWDR